MRHLLLLGCLLAAFLTGTPAADQNPLQPVKHSATAPAGQSTAPPLWKSLNSTKLDLKSEAAVIVDNDGNEIYSKHGDDPQPIASITKLMTAMVILDGKLPMDERISITKADRDLIQLTGSRLAYGATLTRKQMLQLALMASENRAANALGRNWPGGMSSFVEAMNRKARSLGMHNSHFQDPAGLDPGNVASARDVVKMVKAAMQYPQIRKATTTRTINVYPYKGRGPLTYSNTNRLLKNKTWTIQLSKTGYLNEAGRCLAMQTEIADRELVIVLLNSYGKLTPFGDSNRIRKWIERGIEG
ncbi:MAG TPA: D-alanyl-D-alanine endopeptidase [Gammaproteobacteria bacterium]|nr:D-alanyl-D-alanine endopeptidase [Gammaproteobacteria bacterium]